MGSEGPMGGLLLFTSRSKKNIFVDSERSVFAVRLSKSYEKDNALREWVAKRTRRP